MSCGKQHTCYFGEGVAISERPATLFRARASCCIREWSAVHDANFSRVSCITDSGVEGLGQFPLVGKDMRCCDKVFSLVGKDMRCCNVVSFHFPPVTSFYGLIYVAECDEIISFKSGSGKMERCYGVISPVPPLTKSN